MKDLLERDIHFAFNVWDFNSAKYIMDAAAGIKKDVILQTSSGVFRNLPQKEFRAFVSSYSESLGINVWLNLDHCKDEELLIQAIDSKWDAVMADASFLSLKDNISFTNKITDMAHSKGIMVEAEIGQVVGVEDDICVKKEDIASCEDIKCFLEETDVDLIAVAFGNAHGAYKVPPVLDFGLVEYTTSITEVPFVVHGGSGLPKEDIKRLISIKGVKKINISTEVKQAYRQAISHALEDGVFELDGFQPVNVDRYMSEEFNLLVHEKYSLIGDI